MSCRNLSFCPFGGAACARLLTPPCPVDFQIKGSFTGKRSEEAFNPYGQGNVISNCLDVLCGPTYPSLIGKSPRPVPSRDCLFHCRLTYCVEPVAWSSTSCSAVCRNGCGGRRRLGPRGGALCLSVCVCVCSGAAVRPSEADLPLCPQRGATFQSVCDARAVRMPALRSREAGRWLGMN